jgi:hypothetical protein
MNNHVENKQWSGEAAGVGTWGRTFQGWAVGSPWGTCGGADGVSISQAHVVRASGEGGSLARLNDAPTDG